MAQPSCPPLTMLLLFFLSYVCLFEVHHVFLLFQAHVIINLQTELKIHRVARFLDKVLQESSRIWPTMSISMSTALYSFYTFFRLGQDDFIALLQSTSFRLTSPMGASNL